MDDASEPSNPLTLLSESRAAADAPDRPSASSRSPRGGNAPSGGASATTATGSPRPGPSAGGPTPPRKPTPPEATGGQASLWGAMLIGLAVIIGAVLLIKGYQLDGALVSSQPIPGPTTTESTLPGAGNPTLPTLTTSTTAPAKPQSEVNVRILNAGAKAGKAGDFVSKLKAGGYAKAAAGDAPKPVTASQVYWAPGYQGNAVEVAKTLGLAQSAVAQLPDPPPAPLNGAQVLVILGPDVK